MRAADRMELVCSAGRGVAKATVRRKGDVLFVDLYQEAMLKEWVLNSTAAYRLPCGASLSLRGIDFKDPGFVREMSSPCKDRCRDAEDRCDKDCRQRLTRASGELDDEGDACVQGCSDGAERCHDRCPPWSNATP